MTSKERLLNALRGKPVDRVAWCPNLAYWMDFPPEQAKGKSYLQVLKDMDADLMIRGFDPSKEQYEHLRMYDTIYHNCTIEEHKEGGVRHQTITTPIGTLHAYYILSPLGETWFLKEHPIKEPEDYAIATYLFDHCELVANYEPYLKAVEAVGDEVLIIPMLVPELNIKSGFQAMIEYWVGTEQLIYDEMDYPDEVEGLVQSIGNVHRRAAEISAQSPAEIFLTWEDTSTTNINPHMYEKYILPELNEWSAVLQAEGKMYMQHACGHLKHLLPIMATSNINGIESISPVPTGNITMEEARKALPAHQFLVGGIEPTVFLNSTMEELTAYVKDLLQVMEGYPFVLANSDSCPPGVAYEKFLLISKIVRGEV